VCAIDPQTAWVAGIDGYVARTVDGGKSWQQIKASIPTTHLFAINSADGERVVLGGNATLLISDNEGGDFRELRAEPPITYGWIYDVAKRGAEGFVCVGKGGWVYLSDRQAGTWERAKY
jgi:photosystem II stability/assembly factor-like uncharacterized protein